MISNLQLAPKRHGERRTDDCLSMADFLQKAGSLCGLEALSGMVNVPGMKYVGFDDYIPAIEGMYNKRCLGVMVGKAEWTQIVCTIPPNDHDNLNLNLYGAAFRE
jgi:hypothetical protein